MHFTKNIIEFVQEKSIKINDIRTIEVSENYFGLPISAAPVSIAYSGLTPRCVDGPLPYSTIQSIAFTTNLATRAAGPLLSLEHSFSQDLSGSKLMISGNTILAPCMCGQVDQHSNTSTGRLYLMQVETEQCLDQGMLRPREQVCKGGDASLLGDCVKDDTGVSPIFVGLLAALVAALVTAVVVGAACRFCGWDGGQVEDGGKREA